MDDVLRDGTFARCAGELGARLRKAADGRSALADAVAHLL
jgi:hypothetical protein